MKRLIKIYSALFLIVLLNACAPMKETFTLPDGSTIRQVNSESYIYCAGESREDRKYIEFVKKHPLIDGIEIYRHTIFDEKLTKNAIEVYKRRQCDEPLFFLDGKLISKIGRAHV